MKKLKTTLAALMIMSSSTIFADGHQLKVGMITTLSGGGSGLGIDVRDGFMLAVKGNQNISVIIKDDQRKPDIAVQLADKMIQSDKVDVLTGIIWSNLAMAVVPAAVNQGKFYLSPNAGPSKLAGKGCHENYFNVAWQNDNLHEAAGGYANSAGFKNSLKVTTTTADSSLAAGQRTAIIHRVEGNNISHLDWGTSDAKSVTLSFWVRSSITGTHGGAIGNGVDNRAYPFTYTISSADTWEYKTITIAGDTTGTWATDTGRSLQIAWGLGVGTTYSGTAGAWESADRNSATGATTDVIGTLNATWYLTGVQLEAGTTATDFEHLQFGQQMQLCQRYFYSLGGTAAYEFIAHGMFTGTTNPLLRIELPVKMRSAPTLSTSGTFLTKAGSSNLSTASFSVDQSATQTYSFSATISGGTSTVGYAALMFANNSTAARFNLSAEL